MESSRGGPLSTFIMMLPLIVVPAIAMLKPVGQEGSMLSDLLSAAPPRDDSHSAEEIADAVFSEVPGEEDAVSSAYTNSSASDDDFAELDAQLFDEAGNIGAGSDFAPRRQPSAARRDSPAYPFSPRTTDRTAEQQLNILQQMGSSNSLWFDPGDGQFGFVAFFKSGNGIISYRFEAIEHSRSEAIQNVLKQARSWQLNPN